MPSSSPHSQLSGAQLRRTRGRTALVAFMLSLCAVLILLSGVGSTTVSSQAQFAHPGFEAAWARSDGLVAQGAARRPWIWGPVPGRSLSEPFAGLPGNTHLVQYFDKGRMEINNPSGNPADPFFVTNGLLAVELISGQMQTGMTTYERRSPASINLASDSDDRTAPTYQSFNSVSNYAGAPGERRRTSQVGQVVRTAIDRQGVTQPWPSGHPDYGVRVAHFEPSTGHNIPDVFWQYLNQETEINTGGSVTRGPLFSPWFAVTGLPISEAYWSYVKIDGRYTDVLIQAYERRVLTFVPHFAEPFKVQMANIGQHYYDWRYLNRGVSTPGPALPTPTSPGMPARANVSIDGIEYRKSIIDLNGNFVTITNRGQAPVLLNGWWIDSPKWSFVDRFYFPPNITMRPGASLRVHAGPGNNTAEDIYMFRTTVMWEGQPYDLAVLYDNFGREIDRFFPAAEVGVQPTATRPPGTPGTPGPASTPGTPGTVTVTPTPGTRTPVPTGSPGTATRTVAVPSPQGTTQATVSPQGTASATGSPGTATRTPTRTPTGQVTGTPGTATPTSSPGTTTPTRTTTATATRTPTP